MSFTYNIGLSFTGDRQLDSVITAIGRLETSIDRVNQSVLNQSNSFSRMQRQGTTSARSLESSFARLAAQIGAAKFITDSIRTTAEIDTLNKSIIFAGGAEGAKNLEFVRDTAKSLKVDLRSAIDGFKTLSGSMMGTNFTAAQQRDLFESLSIAARVNGLDAGTFQRISVAMGQMASKGKVSMEELRQQFGEALPGGFALAARSMGMTVEAFDKAVSSGNVLATDLLPNLSAELRRTYASGLEAQMKSPTAMFTEMSNSILELKTVLGTELMPAVTALVQGFLIPGVKWIIDNKEAIIILATGLGTLALGLQAATAAQWLLNVAMGLNPIGATIMVISALSAAFIYAYRNSATFRYTLHGLWTVIKDVGTAIFKLLIAPLKVASGLLLSIFTGDWNVLKASLKEWGEAIQGIAKSALSVGENFNKGFQNKRLSEVTITDERSKAFTNPLGSTFAKDQPIGVLVPAKTPDPTASGKPDSAIKEGMKGINEGGRHSKVINIQLDNIVQRLDIHAGTVTEGMDDMVDMVTRKLTQIINNANQVQTTF